MDKNGLNKLIEQVRGSEKVTKSSLGTFSRESIPYVQETGDVGIVNRMIAVLTPANKKVAILYYKKFLGWKFEKETSTFKDKMEGEELSKRLIDSIEFLEDPKNNIWTFISNSVKVEGKEIDYSKAVTRAIQNALSGKKGEPLSIYSIMGAILSADGVKAEELLSAIKAFTPDNKEV